ncbi:histidine kinase [Propionibacterium ruminifibrarum]|uniref:Sensor-like histidine kinase SenX3 n=1 Tax=Propionibacterium ruminifibrarum TaxID=1962131 RepID=A0A375I4M1_9ACTN|nr:HAMP domain-containing sensor histidine kinase [Propionibacterium ruminifibrarum]SPF69046.1 histidine kinase [Propionibacterium ruminifibrarum]
MHALVWAVVLLGVACAGSGVLALVLRRRLTLLRADNEQLRSVVRRRMERPQIFSHEVRTPLALIRGATELLLEGTPGPLTERQREFVETIADNTAQMTQLSETMLTEARIEAQLLTLRRERVEVRSLVRQAVSELRHFTRIPIELDNTGARISLDGDPALLRQALWNLVNNAVRHAGPGATISVQVSEADETAVIAVTDDGAGMTDSDRARLFQPFSSPPGENDRHGTGLGMLVAQRVIAAHGGRLLIDTIDGRGTSILCALPLGDPATSLPPPAADQETP